VTARVLPHPTVNLTLESTLADTRQLIITGVARGVFTRTLTGRDAVFGIKLRPGVARQLVTVGVRSLPGSGQPAASVMPSHDDLSCRLLRAGADPDRVVAAESFFADLPGPSQRLLDVQDAVTAFTTDPSVHRVGEVAVRLGLTERTLQRLFAEYLGVSPGWVLRRGRLHAAAERLIQLTIGETSRSALADVAAEYGYADQAHLTGEFTRIIGIPPRSWLRSLVAEHPIA
jgi:transcriptional regulator GlxA family with amidase domain